MRSTWVVVLVVALAAGAAGAGLFMWTAGSRDRRPASEPSVQAALDRLEQRLAGIEQRLPSGATPPTLQGRANTPAQIAQPELAKAGEAAEREAAETRPPAKAEPPATMEQVRAYLAEKMKEERQERGARFQVTVGDAGDVDLKDVAAALGIDEVKTARIQELFRNEGEEQLKAVFGTDDIGAIRQRILDSQRDPAEKVKLQDELLRNLMTSLPRLRRTEETKNAALRELLGSALYERFRTQPVREGDVDEFDALLEDVLGTAQPKTVSGAR